MSIYDKASLVQIPSGYKSGTLYSVVPNDADGDFTVTGDPEGEATRVNKDGLIETVSANVPRLNYNFIDGVVQPDPHLLLEPTSTNLLQRSEDYANAYWLKARVGSSATGFTAPDGSSNATYFEQASGQTTGGVIYKNAFTSVSSGIYTFSIWAKKGEKDYVVLQTRANNANQRTWFNLSNGTIGTDNNDNSKIEEYPNGWYRLSCQRTSTGTDDVQIYYYLADTNGTDTVTDSGGIYIWGSQVEKQDYLTSYIPTTTEQVTRTSEQCEVTSGLENIIGQTEGTVFIDFEYLYETTTDSSTDALRDLFVVGTTSDLSEAVYFDNYRSQFRVFIAGSGMTTINLGNNNAGAAQPNTRYKLAIKYKTGDCKSYLNGSLLGSSTGTVSFATDLDGIFFSYNSGSRPFKNQKRVYQLMVFNEALSDAELITLTS